MIWFESQDLNRSVDYFTSQWISAARLKAVSDISWYSSIVTLRNGSRLRRKKDHYPPLGLALSVVILYVFLPFLLCLLSPSFLYTAYTVHHIRNNLTDALASTLANLHSWQMAQKGLHQHYRVRDCAIGQHPILRDTESCSMRQRLLRGN